MIYIFVKYSFLCYTVGPYSLSILYIIVCKVSMLFKIPFNNHLSTNGYKPMTVLGEGDAKISNNNKIRFLCSRSKWSRRRKK